MLFLNRKPPVLILLSLLTSLSSLSSHSVFGQQVGTVTTETHPRLIWQKCTRAGGCTIVQGSIVLDANWRWTYLVSGYDNCFFPGSGIAAGGGQWNTSLCPTNALCASNCALDGADYSGTYAITTSGNALSMKLYATTSSGRNVGSRVYLLENETTYQMFKPLNQEVSFDVDVYRLPCGFDGGVVLSGMDADGGVGRFATNKAGAKYGTGYCDATCRRDVKFINGQANAEGWTVSTKDPRGSGRYGSCCSSMHVWEANTISGVFTAHPCDDTTQQTRCDGSTGQCGSSTCDSAGCDFNSYRNGNRTFYGPGMTVDTTRKMTVVTQFFTNDNTTSGSLVEIRRLYVQDGRVIQNSKVNIPGIDPSASSITDGYCTQQKTAFKDPDSFSAHGSLAALGQAMAKAMVLSFSINDDPDPTRRLLWLDGTYPIDGDPSVPGVVRGSCAPYTAGPGIPEGPDPGVTFSNIRFGDIGSTYYAGST